MFEPNSRYDLIETATFIGPDGQPLAYKRRRLLPQPESLTVLAEVTVTEGDRLDTITARTLGDPQQYWRVCDASRAMNPAELTATPGLVLRVPVPQAEAFYSPLGGSGLIPPTGTEGGA
ncbi:LysM domain-containing protein [Methyloterricola oryzae]|uniref:LysM domain-containing protein n=1 Tax=Methyloterricola oryzae TaxID=1495050 RepID=UPI0019109018|nr:LysM domain-containing protein [Methyloterricola oryzae]